MERSILRPPTIELPAGYLDKVYGCWLGKSCGGTLGAPLEKPWGQPEAFDIWWYPELPEGGIPNDDLELQLVWLKCLEEVGPGLDAGDLARYWLIYTGYNFDEYGLSKANLRLGLRPPLSGSYNNWFRDCMGSPIRSEIWACVAPGSPRLAVRLAYQDAICDHAGGEGVVGEVFNAAVQSAAFVLSDRDELLDIGLSYVPPESATHQAIRAARRAHASGLDWAEARAAVLEATPHDNAQYAPVNLGFQVVGWLYGEDFGDALCKAVNCGYDTDCTGATLGATLGIIYGRTGLPARWTEPIRDEIPTNESWGGLRHLSNGPNPAPKTLDELTERVAAVALKTLALAAHDNGIAADPTTADSSRLHADERTRELWQRSPSATRHIVGPVSVSVDYGGAPAIRPNEHRSLVVKLQNLVPDPIQIRGSITPPSGWTATTDFEVALDVNETRDFKVDVSAPTASQLRNSNVLDLRLRILGWPAPDGIPIVFVGARQYRVAGPYGIDAVSHEAVLQTSLPPETLKGPSDDHDARGFDWKEIWSYDHELPLADKLRPGSVAYLQGFLEAPKPLRARLGVSANCACKAWVNGGIFVYPPQRIRPSYEGHGQQYVDIDLVEGWNEILLKFFRPLDHEPFEGYLLLSDVNKLFQGLCDVEWTRLPWDSAYE